MKTLRKKAGEVTVIQILGNKNVKFNKMFSFI